MKILVAIGGAQQGPFDIETLNRMVASGQIPVHGTLAWWPGQASWVQLAAVPGIRVAAAAAPQISTAAPPPQPPAAPQGDATGGLIPYKNGPALAAYYLGILALVPLLGFLAGIASCILGVMGLRKRSREPHVKGSAHAVIGIVLGGLSILVHLAVLILAGMANARR